MGYEPIPGPVVNTVNSSNPNQLTNNKAKDCFRLAMQYRSEENSQEAMMQFIEAHKNGHPNALNEVYVEFYVLGMKNKEIRNFTEAFNMFKEAAQGINDPSIDGHPNAQCELAICYMTGNGTEKNLDQARIWFKHAIARGHHLAPQLLKIMESQNDPVISIQAGEHDQVTIKID